MHKEYGPRVFQKVRHFCRCVRGIDRHEGAANLQTGQIQSQRLWAFVNLGEHTIAWCDPAIHQYPGDAVDLVPHVNEAPYLTVAQGQANAVRVAIECRPQLEIEVFTHVFVFWAI